MRRASERASEQALDENLRLESSATGPGKRRRITVRTSGGGSRPKDEFLTSGNDATKNGNADPWENTRAWQFGVTAFVGTRPARLHSFRRSCTGCGSEMYKR